MQRPLDQNRLLALVENGVDAGTFYIDLVKKHFAQQNISEGVFNLILAFGFSRPYLRIYSVTWEKWGPDEWRIDFGNRPFTHLSVRPDPGCRAFVKVYEDDKQLQAYELLDHPEQWQAVVKWLWDYGNDRLICQAAIEARRKASRRYSKLQVPLPPSRSTPNRKESTHKHPPDSALQRPLRHTYFKAQASRSKRKIIPSNLGMSRLSVSDIEGVIGQDQALHEKDPNGRMAAVSPDDHSVHGIARPKDIKGDAYMNGAE